MLTALSQRVLQRIQNPVFQSQPAYSAFLKDVTALTEIASDQSLPGITAETWLEQIDVLSDDKLSAYIATYRQGCLDPRAGLPLWQKF